MGSSMSEASENFQEPTLPGFDTPTSLPVLEDGTTPFDSLAGRRTAKSGPARAPVSRSRPRAKVKAPTTSDIFGPSSSGSSRSAALQTSLESRLRARLNTVGSIEYLQTWKESATPAGRRFLAHTASARTIYVNVSTGALLSGVPTPSVGDATGGRVPPAGTSSTGIRPDGKKAQMGLQTIALLTAWERTPRASDGDGGVMEIRPGTTGKYKLRDYAQLAAGATATVTDARGSRNATSGRSNPDSEHHTGETLNDQIRGIAGWATPQASDPVEGARTDPSSPQKCLGRDIKTFLIPGLTFASFLVPTGKRVVLDPEFSLWLMGFPEAWAKLAPNHDDWQDWQLLAQKACNAGKKPGS